MGCGHLTQAILHAHVSIYYCVYIYMYVYVWQSRVEIERYSVAYFDRITVFEAL